jgi:hypothetical protein
MAAIASVSLAAVIFKGRPTERPRVRAAANPALDPLGSQGTQLPSHPGGWWRLVVRISEQWKLGQTCQFPLHLSTNVPTRVSLLAMSTLSAIGHLDADWFCVAAERTCNRFPCGKAVGVLGNQAANLNGYRPCFHSPARLTIREMSVVYEFEE